MNSYLMAQLLARLLILSHTQQRSYLVWLKAVSLRILLRNRLQQAVKRRMRLSWVR